MDVSPKDATLMALAARDVALAEASQALNHRLNGNPQHDNQIQLQLDDIHDERVAIAARRSAISMGGGFTPPTADDVARLQAAVTAVHNAVTNSANVTVLLTTATALLNTSFNAAESAA